MPLKIKENKNAAYWDPPFTRQRVNSQDELKIANMDSLTEEELEFVKKHPILIAGGPREITGATPPKEALVDMSTNRDSTGMTMQDTEGIAKMRLLRVEELLALGYTANQIITIVNDELEQLNLPPFVSRIYEIDIAMCRKAWAHRVDTAREELIALQLERYERLYRRAIEKDDVMTTLRVLESENKLMGLEAPRKVQLSSDLTIADITEERRQRAKEFFERRRDGGAHGDREVIPARVSEVSDGG